MRKRAIPVLIVLLLILIVGGVGMGVHLYQKYKPTEDRMDLNTYYGEQKAGQAPLILNTEKLEMTARVEDGQVYLPMELVNGQLNDKFYWGEEDQLLIYTTPYEKLLVKPDRDLYVGEEEYEEDYVIVLSDESGAYVHADFVKKFTDIEYTLYEEPQRVVVESQWDNVSVVEVKEDTVVRYRGGIKSEILTDVKAGTQLRLIEDLEEWSHVVSPDGCIGYVEKKYVHAPETLEASRVFEEEEYTSLTREEPINLAWHQVTSEAANETLEDAVKDMKGVNVISPTWFSIKDNNGGITNFATEGYVKKAHKMGLEVWGLVDNFSGDISTYDVLSRYKSRQTLIKNLVKQALRFDLDGINIDFETLSEETAPHFIQFLRELSIHCRKQELVLSVDNPVPENYTGYYNRTAQGEVVDYVIIMGYDEHFMGSEEAGSVASLPWVKQGIEDTLAEVPAEKVINAIPFYTRVWKTSAGVVTSEAVGMKEAAEFVKKRKIETYWDETTGQNYGEYEDGNDTYQVWLEDEESIAEKMKLIQEYELAGVAHWKLGFERDSVWKVIAEGLK